MFQKKLREAIFFGAPPAGFKKGELNEVYRNAPIQRVSFLGAEAIFLTIHAEQKHHWLSSNSFNWSEPQPQLAGIRA